MNLPTITTWALSSSCLKYQWNEKEDKIVGTFENDMTEQTFEVELSYEQVADAAYNVGVDNALFYLESKLDKTGEDCDDIVCDDITEAVNDAVCFGNLELFKRALGKLWMEKQDEADYYLNQWLKQVE